MGCCLYDAERVTRLPAKDCNVTPRLENTTVNSVLSVKVLVCQVWRYKRCILRKTQISWLLLSLRCNPMLCCISLNVLGNTEVSFMMHILITCHTDTKSTGWILKMSEAGCCLDKETPVQTSLRVCVYLFMSL